MMKSLLTVSAALVFSAVAVATETTPPAFNLTGSEWGPENGLGQFVQFKADGELFGFAGCNSFIGTYTQDGDRLTISQLSVTKKLCVDIMGAERAFIEGLQNAQTITFDGLDAKVYDTKDIWVLGLRRRDWD